MRLTARALTSTRPLKSLDLFGRQRVRVAVLAAKVPEEVSPQPINVVRASVTHAALFDVSDVDLGQHG
jgi:hypothetical protein